MWLLSRNGQQALAIPSYSRLVLTIAIIPVKSFSGGNLRLASAIDDTHRQALGRALAGHVARTVVECDLVPLIVTGDPEVASWARVSGFSTIPDPGTGLNAAAATGAEWVSHTRSKWTIIHADLPLLRPEDLIAVTEVTGDVIAPSFPPHEPSSLNMDRRVSTDISIVSTRPPSLPGPVCYMTSTPRPISILPSTTLSAPG